MSNNTTTYYTIASAAIRFDCWTTNTSTRTTEHVDVTVCDYDHDIAATVSGVNVWYNRPWQAFTFQRAGIDATRAWLKACRAAELDAWKARHGYKRLTATRAAEWEQERRTCWQAGEGQTAYACAALYLAAVQPQRSAEEERRHAAELDTLEHLREVRELSDGRVLFEGTRREDGTRRAFTFTPSSHAVEVL